MCAMSRRSLRLVTVVKAEQEPIVEALQPPPDLDFPSKGPSRLFSEPLRANRILV